MNPARVAMVLAPGVAMLALASLPLYAADRCGFADHAAALSAARDRVLKSKPFVLPGSPLHSVRHELDSCALLAFSIDAQGRAWRIVVQKTWPGAIAARAARDALEGYVFVVPAQPRQRYLIGMAYAPAERMRDLTPPGRTRP